MLFVILPMAVRRLDIGEMAVGFIFAGSSVFFMICSPLWGKLSDHKGRRPVLLTGLAGNTLSLLAMSAVSAAAFSGHLTALATIILFALARLIYGSVGSAMLPASQAYIADRTSISERTRIMASLTAGAGLGTALGPSLAAWGGGQIGMPEFLLFSAMASGAVLGIVALGLPEHRPPQERRRPRLAILPLAKDKRLWPFLLVGTGIWTAQSVFLQTVHFYLLDRTHLPEIKVVALSGTILASGAALSFLAQFILIPLFKLRPRLLMFGGAGLSALGALFLSFSATPLSIGGSFLLAAFGLGLSRPGVVAGASLSVDPHEQGTAAGLASSSAGAGFLLAPFTGLALYQMSGPASAYYFNGIILAFVALLAFFNRRIRTVG